MRKTPVFESERQESTLLFLHSQLRNEENWTHYLRNKMCNERVHRIHQADQGTLEHMVLSPMSSLPKLQGSVCHEAGREKYDA